MKSQEDTNENTNEIAGSRPISASVGQQTEVGSVERVENPSTPRTEFQGTESFHIPNTSQWGSTRSFVCFLGTVGVKCRSWSR